jgi:hypothetical protein
MSPVRAVPTPKGSKAAGKRLWRALCGEYDFEEHELALLREAVRLVDLLDELQDAVVADGAVVTDSKGDTRVHPAAVEARQSRLALARVLAMLRLPEGEDAGANLARPQRRGGVRKPYTLHPLGDAS